MMGNKVKEFLDKKLPKSTYGNGQDGCILHRICSVFDVTDD